MISIIIPVYNGEKTIGKCLSSLLEQTKKPDEIIVVGDGSEDRTEQIVEGFVTKHRKVKLIKQERKGPASARNLGLKKAKGDVILFTDADCFISPDWISNLVGFLGNGVAGVGGPELIPKDDSLFGRCVGKFYSSFFGSGLSRIGMNSEKEVLVRSNSCCNAGYLKKSIEEAGFFDQRLIMAEDVDLDARIRDKGYKVMYTPKAKVFHYRSGNPRSFFIKMFRYAVGKAQLVKKRKRVDFSPFQLIPLISLIALPFLIIFGLYSILWYLVIAYALMVFLNSLYLSAKIGLFRTFPVFLSLHVIQHTAWAFGFLAGLIFY